MIRQVIFDVGGVLLSFDPDAMVGAATRDPAEAALLRREIFAHHDWNRLDRGAEEEEETVFRSMKSRLPQELWPKADDIRDHWHESLRAREDMGELVCELYGMGMSLYILSNAPYRFYEFRDRIPGYGLMTGVVLSCEEKLLKPDPDLFRRMLERYDLRAEECFFIDDSPLNVESAQWCGWSAFQFRRDMTELRAALRAAGVAVRP